MTTIEETKDIELVYRGVRAALGSEFDDYKSCVVTALNVYYDEYPEMILEQSDDDYQGNTVGVAKGSNYIHNFGPKYYYYSFGWGSCSGCDMLEGAGPIETIQTLRSSIIPIPLETISVTKYLENEINNSFDKGLVTGLLYDWKKYMESNSVDDFGKRVYKH
jgi:hypothetical protein